MTNRRTLGSLIKLADHFAPDKQFAAKLSQHEDKQAFAADPVPEAELPATNPAIDHEKLVRQINRLLHKSRTAKATAEQAAEARETALRLMKEHAINEDDLKPKKKQRPPLPTNVTMEDFYANLEEHDYIFIPTRRHWPASTIASLFGPFGPVTLDAARPIHVMTWAPGQPELLKDTLVIGDSDTGFIPAPGKNTFNTYRAPPVLIGGNAKKAGPWIDHTKKVFPNDWEHIFKWLAHLIQKPAEKVNHCLVTGSDAEGIGKDTIFYPIVIGLGSWNCKEVSAGQAMDEKFNPFLEALLCRISEAADLGEADRFSFHNRRKTWLVSPPTTLSVADKNVKQHPVINVVRIIISTNNKIFGVYFTIDDRRHYVAWSDLTPADFEPDYFVKLYAWFADDGTGVMGAAHVIEYLRTYDISKFDPKAPPPKTPAWHEIVASGQSSDDNALADLLDYIGGPIERLPALTIPMLLKAAQADREHRFDDVVGLLEDDSKKKLPHFLNKCGYVAVRNPDETRGRWFISKRRTNIYALKTLAVGARLDAAYALEKADREMAKAARAAKKAKHPQGAGDALEGDFYEAAE